MSSPLLSAAARRSTVLSRKLHRAQLHQLVVRLAPLLTSLEPHEGHGGKGSSLTVVVVEVEVDVVVVVPEAEPEVEVVETRDKASPGKAEAASDDDGSAPIVSAAAACGASLAPCQHQVAKAVARAAHSSLS